MKVEFRGRVAPDPMGQNLGMGEDRRSHRLSTSVSFTNLANPTQGINEQLEECESRVPGEGRTQSDGAELRRGGRSTVAPSEHLCSVHDASENHTQVMRSQ